MRARVRGARACLGAALLGTLAAGCHRGVGDGRAPTPDGEAANDEYFLVGPSGASAFDEPAAASKPPGAAPAARTLRPGFGLTLRERRTVNGVVVARTGSGRWIALDALVPARPAALRGVDLGPGAALDFAWVATAGAPVFGGPALQSPIGTRALFAREALRGPCPAAAGACAIKGGFMRAQDLRVPAPAPRPPEVGPTERWIDVDLASRTLVAYEGDRPVFAALVAIGTGAPGRVFATPEGTFRVRSKLRRATMDNLEHEGVIPYSYEDIPFVQYFTERVALHAAPWHQRFGHPASHGCVNLAPTDAERLFAFTGPRLAPGEPEGAASPTNPGTIVRVRGARRTHLEE